MLPQLRKWSNQLPNVEKLRIMAIINTFCIVCHGRANWIMLGFVCCLTQCNIADKINQMGDTLLDLKDDSSCKATDVRICQCSRFQMFIEVLSLWNPANAYFKGYETSDYKYSSMLITDKALAWNRIQLNFMFSLCAQFIFFHFCMCFLETLAWTSKHTTTNALVIIMAARLRGFTCKAQ